MTFPPVNTSSAAFGEDIDDPDVLPPDPVELLMRWLPEFSSVERPLMALSTMGLDGYPNTRHVLLSSYSPEGLTFHTDRRSAKAAELAASPRASVALAWPEIGRQLVVRGDVETTPAPESAEVYARRVRGLQLLAWLNDADLAVEPRATRRERWAEFGRAHPDGSLTPPADWAGYLLRPRSITFWRADTEGPSNRHQYDLVGGSWRGRKLPG